jgi:hypothetical protein
MCIHIRKPQVFLKVYLLTIQLIKEVLGFGILVITQHHVIFNHRIWFLHQASNTVFFNLPLLFSDLLYMDAEVYMEKRILSITRDGLRFETVLWFLICCINSTVTLLLTISSYINISESFLWQENISQQCLFEKYAVAEWPIIWKHYLLFQLMHTIIKS